MGLIRIGEPKEFTLLPEGEYEVFVNKSDKADVSNPAFEASRIMFTVRDDIEAMVEFAKENLFSNIRTTWDWMFSAIGHATGIPKDTEFESLDEFLATIKGKSLVVKVKHSVVGENTYANIKGFKASEHVEYVVPVDGTSIEEANSIV